MRIFRVNFIDATADYSLRWSILIDQPDLWRSGSPGRKRFVAELLAADYESPGRSCHFLRRQQLIQHFQVRRRDFYETEIGMGTQGIGETFNSLSFRNQNDSLSRQERRENTRDR